MKRKVFIISWYYNIASVFATIVAPIILIVITALYFGSDDIIYSIIIYIVSCISFLLGFFLLGKYLIQWVVIDEKGITARSLLSVLRHINWEDVTEIAKIRLSYIPIDPKMNWFMFVDNKNGEAYLKTAFNVKGKFIKIKASKRNEQFLLQLHPEIPFVDYPFTKEEK